MISNFELPFLPEREKKERSEGITMMMDKGLSVSDVSNFVENAGDFTDLVKFGFGTSLIVKNLEDKIKIYKEAGVKPYFGGTLFEAFIVRNLFDEFRRFIDKFKIEIVEVSDGSITLEHDLKCEFIEKLSRDYTVMSEVGSKEEGILISPSKWIRMMSKEIEAGSWKVIAEGRESGSVGIFRPNGTPHTILINKIINKVSPNKILWEAPIKKQQVWFINLFGANVNLGNIAYNEVIPCECLRLGLRGDTFFNYLPEDTVASHKQLPNTAVTKK